MGISTVLSKQSNYVRHEENLFIPVLGLTVIQLIFFLVAGTQLCFGFCMRIMLIAHWYFRCCYVMLTPSQGLSEPHALPVRRYKNLGGSLAKTDDQTDQRNIWQYRMSFPMYKLREKDRGGLSTAWGQAVHWPVDGEEFYYVPLVALGVYYPLFFFYVPFPPPSLSPYCYYYYILLCFIY